MKVLPINQLSELQETLKKSPKTWCLIYKNGSEQSDCAYQNLGLSLEALKGIQIVSVDVSQVRDIHFHYQISSAPSLLQFDNEQLINIYKGCNGEQFYHNLFKESLYKAEIKSDDKPQKRVTVYSTPSCSWCTTLKTHLRKHNIKFNDIDVSKDQAAAQAMVQRSGQQGVPQTDIAGEMIIGFDKKRINELLNIQG
jgi:glutaredoxin-like YruB-family protein